MIIEAVLFAERHDKRPNLPVIVARHEGEEVVFNLVVEMTCKPVIEGTGIHIARAHELRETGEKSEHTGRER